MDKVTEVRGQIKAEIAERRSWIVDHNGGQDRVVVVDYPDEAFVGKTLQQIANDRNTTYQEVVVYMALNGYEEVIGGAWTRGYGINDMDVTNYYQQDSR